MFYQPGYGNYPAAGRGGMPPPHQPGPPVYAMYGGGGGGGPEVMQSAILEFPSPYPPGHQPPPMYGGGGGAIYQQRPLHHSSGYVNLPHFAPQQPTSAPAQPPPSPQQPPMNAAPAPQQKPIQPSGMIRPLRRTNDQVPVGSAAASSPTSPSPPSATSVPSSGSLSSQSSYAAEYEDYSLASAPPEHSFFPAYGGHQPVAPVQLYGPPQMAPDPYRVGASPSYQPLNNSGPTHYQQMPTNFGDKSHQDNKQNNYLHMSAPVVSSRPPQGQASPQPPQQYSQAPQLEQRRPQAQPAQKPQAGAALSPAPAAADKAKPVPPPRGPKVLPSMLPPKRHSTNVARPESVPQDATGESPRRTISAPLSELEEKFKKRRESAYGATQTSSVGVAQQALANLSVTKAGTADKGKEDEKDSTQLAKPPIPSQLYVAVNGMSFTPESPHTSRKEQSNGTTQSAQSAVNYMDGSNFPLESDDEDSGGEGDDYESYISDSGDSESSATALPSATSLPSASTIPVVEQRPSKEAVTKLSAEESKDKRGGSSRKGAKRENRWEIDFDELEIDKQIGHGAYGSVHKGKWRNTVVAIKTIRENMASFHEAKLTEFRAEAEMMMNMRPHTNVVQLFGVCMRPYMAIVVEYLSGGSLQELLLSNEEIDLHMALKISLHAAAGVAHLHAEGICHRDLAARNLLLTSKNKDYMVVKVADFGLSRFTEEAEENFTTCKVGPLKWMPPESLQEQKYSFKSDAWAMGVVLWEIFSRREPYPGVSPVQVAINVTSRGVCLNPPSSCPREIAQLMYECWSYDPKDRPDFRTIALTIERVLAMNLPNYNITPMSSDEPVSCKHPGTGKACLPK